MREDLRPFFNPSGVALLGASSNPGKLSYGILRNMLSYGFQGQVYPVNPKAESILGLRCYADIRQVPDPVDLAVIVVPAPAVPEVLEASGERGIRAAIIISGGFKEVGAEGAALEKRCLEIARHYQIRLIGPNCVGTLDLYSGLNTTFIQGVPAKGGIGFISQSGAVGGGVIDYWREKGVGFANFASLGNEADLTETDLIEYLAEEPNTRVIVAYVESIRDGQRFMRVAREVTPHKPIVLLKAGRTEAGARAVSSHTGSLAGANEAYRAAFLQSGVIEVDSISQLFNVAMALDTQPLPTGRRVAIVTNAGGPAALASDSLANHGLQLATLCPETRQTLRQVLNPAAQVDNPIDMLGGAEPPDYEFALSQALNDSTVDAAIAILVPQALINPADVAQSIVASASGKKKPLITCFMGDYSISHARRILHESGIPLYQFPEEVGPVLGALWRYAQWREQPRVALPPPGGCDTALAERWLKHTSRAVLGEAESRPILAAYGLPLVPGAMAHTPEEAVTIAAKIGFPVVMKVISPDVLHKSDIGGVRLNVHSTEEVKTAFEDLVNSVRSRLPHAVLEGILVEAMAPPGQEVIVGMRRDANFGPLIMFGMGGVYVELFRDVAFRIAPITYEEAVAMIDETRAGKLLRGYRGQAEADIEALVEVILRLGQLALDFPTIQEMEINPLRVLPKGQGALALDCRILLGE